jgi:hypothetical protein
MTRQPKHVDVDKPQGYLKRKLRRWLRHMIRRDTHQALNEALSS